MNAGAPTRKYKSVSMSQRAALVVFFLVLEVWGRRSYTLSIPVGGILFNNRYISGVAVKAEGHYPGNQFIANRVEENRLYTRVTGVESRRPVDIILVRHWVFAVLILPTIPWFALATVRNVKFRRREEAGECARCGYSVAGNTSGVCPECGTPLPFVPFSFADNGVTVSEGVISLARKARYQLHLFVAADADHPIESRIRSVNIAIVHWLRNRGEYCGRIVVHYTSDDPSKDEELLSWMLRVVNQQIPEQKILQAVSIDLVYQSFGGKIRKQLGLGMSSAERGKSP